MDRFGPSWEDVSKAFSEFFCEKYFDFVATQEFYMIGPAVRDE